MKNNQKGLIKTIILIIIALALIKLVWDYDVLNLLDNPQIKAIWDAIKNVLKAIWDFIKSLFSSAF